MISTSKIRNTMAIRKNFSENDRRADLMGSNPHSNGDGFSRSWVYFDAIVEFKSMRIVARAMARDTVKAMFLTPWELPDWKSGVLYILMRI